MLILNVVINAIISWAWLIYLLPLKGNFLKVTTFFCWAWLKSVLTLTINLLNVRQIWLLEYCTIWLSISAGIKYSQIQRDTEADESLQVLKSVIKKGWLGHKSNLPSIISPYFNMGDEMSVQDGVILKRERVAVPRSSRSKLLKRIHSSHIGVNDCLNRVREFVFLLMCHLAHVLTMFQPARPAENMNGFKQRKRWCPLRRQLDPSNELQPTRLSLKERLILGFLRLLLDFFEIDLLRSASSVYVIRQKVKGWFWAPRYSWATGDC